MEGLVDAEYTHSWESGGVGGGGEGAGGRGGAGGGH